MAKFMTRMPDRIPKVIGALRQAWFQYPDLRLGQLLMNVTPNGKDLFYLEDEEIVELLKEYTAKEF